MGFTDWKPEAQGALIGGGANIVAALLAAKGQGKITDAQLAQALAAQKAGVHQQSGRNALDLYGQQSQERRLGYGQVLDSLGPHDLAKGRQQMALDRALMFGGPGGAPQQMRGPGVGSMYQAELPNVSAAAPFYSDSAILASEEPVWNAIAGSTGGRIRPSLEGAGFGADAARSAGARMNTFADKAGEEERGQDEWVRGQLGRSEDMSIEALNQALATGVQNPQKKSGGFWSKLGKGLLAGGAAAAGLFTGGASLSSLPAILSMGAAGASGAMSNGNPLLNAGMSFAGGMAGAGKLPGRDAFVNPTSPWVNSGKAVKGVKFG